MILHNILKIILIHSLDNHISYNYKCKFPLLPITYSVQLCFHFISTRTVYWFYSVTSNIYSISIIIPSIGYFYASCCDILATTSNPVQCINNPESILSTGSNIKHNIPKNNPGTIMDAIISLQTNITHCGFITTTVSKIEHQG